jgi:CDP-glucose 4,6-dehydratase
MDHPDAFWRDRRVFVTGCTGFLGTWVVRELLARGAVVTGLVRDRVPPSELIRDRLFNAVRVVRGRVEDRGRVQQVLAIHEIDTVFHLAGPASDPARFDLPLYAAAREAIPAGRVIVPVGTKDAARETLAVGYAAAARFPIIPAKLPTVFGGGDRGRNTFVARSARALAAGQPVPLASGEERSEPHLYAADAARGLLTVAETIARTATAEFGLVSDEFRIACHPAVTAADVVAALADAVTISFAEPESGPAGTVLGAPATPLSVAAADTLAWYRSAPRSLAFPDAALADVRRRSAA